MRTKKPIVVAVTAAVVSLAGAGYALGGGGGVIWDDGHAAKPGSLDDGKELLPKASVSLAAAVAGAQRATQGAGRTRLVRRRRRRSGGQRRRAHGRDRGHRPAELSL